MAEIKMTSNPIKGIDISAWQGANFPIKRAMSEKGAKYAILRAGGKSESSGALFKDSQFENYYKQAKAAGMPVGAYFYGGATTVAQAKQEASYFLGLLKGKQFEYPVYYDVEAKAQGNLSKAALTAVVEAFCKMVEDAGYFVGVYASRSWFGGEFDSDISKSYAPWVAAWNTAKPAIGYPVQMWQHTVTKNYIDGIEVDEDLCYVSNYPEVIKSLKLNGFGGTADVPAIDNAQIPETPKKSYPEIAREVWLGEWGNGDTRKKLLQEAGYDYNVVQEYVNKMTAPAKTNAEIAREVWAGKWGNAPDRAERLKAAGYDPDAIQKLVNGMKP